ncbi:unnamed protein product [Rangifer tarandus platyrhynchus]|uniref:Uncharacterized protein n=3 Tax=Rangifer tarandus platyrhynchus TaxID=3082113 RepID=A0ABN9A8X5_RANTA|nr:unnamed protein product [Rangifer tarandus platyrhynchus]CAI9181438.1 unnamed protein product [Rangifer tarandus platyrhynchus]
MDECSAGRLDLTEQTPILLGSKAMTANLMDVGDSFGDAASTLVNRSRNSSVEGDDGDDDDVVFIESIQPPSISAPVIADQRHFVFPASRNKKLLGHYSVILPSSRYLASQKEIQVRQLLLMMKRTWKQMEGKRQFLPVLLNGVFLELKTEPKIWISPLPVFQEVRPRLQ